MIAGVGMTRTSLTLRLQQTGGHASGFDYLRLTLALSILVLHAWIICDGFQAVNAIFLSPARPLMRFILPAFFALSGFLVAGSLERSRTLGMFLALRVLRIYPALGVEVLLSAFLLGPFATHLSLSEYFTDPLFLHYLRNVVGDVHFYLPGVFADNPLPGVVNGQLWTIPFELGCYITLSGLMLLGLWRWRVLAPIGVVAVTLAYLAVTLIRHDGVLVPVPGAINGALLVATFLCGVSLYLYRELVPYSAPLCVAAALLGGLCLSVLPGGDFFAPLPVAYVTVYLGLLNPSRRLLRGADYSYGIFLYSFALQQACYHFLPFAREPAGNLLVGLPAALLVAAFSWHCVERPAQRFRKTLKNIETAYLGWRGRIARALTIEGKMG